MGTKKIVESIRPLHSYRGLSFFFNTSGQYLTRLLCSLVKYCSCHSTQNSFIFFLEGTVTNPAIWLVLSAVRIFLFLHRVISSIYVARKYLLIFLKQKSIFSAPNWPSRLGSHEVFCSFSDLTPPVFETDLVIEADNGFLFERTLKSGWSDLALEC